MKSVKLMIDFLELLKIQQQTFKQALLEPTLVVRELENGTSK